MAVLCACSQHALLNVSHHGAQVRYLLLMVYPTTLSAEYSFNCIPALESVLDPRAVPALAYGCIATILVACLLDDHQRYKRAPVPVSHA